MTTPVILIALLVGPLVVSRILNGILGQRRIPTSNLAAFGLALVFVFSGIGHFLKTGGMVEMLPPWIPFRELVVYLSGAFEWGLAVALVGAGTRPMAAWAAAIFLVAILPVNIWAALNHTGLGGHQWGPVYLWIRVPLQGLLIGWSVFVARSTSAAASAADGE